jgi:hypothetical protein
VIIATSVGESSGVNPPAEDCTMTFYPRGARLQQLITSYTDTEPGTPSVVTSIDNLNTGNVTKGQGFPDWKLRIKRGESATTELEGTRYKQSIDASGHISVKRHAIGPLPYLEDQWYLYEMWGPLGAYPAYLEDPSQSSIASVENDVKRAIIAQVRSAQTTLRSLVSAGEMGQTARMMSSRARSLNVGVFGYLNALRKRAKLNRLGRQDLSKRVSMRYVNLRRLVASTWLEYSFGWVPLISDIYDGAHALSRITTFRPPSIRVFKASRSSENTDAWSSGRSIGPMSYAFSTTMSSEYQYKIYGKVNAVPNSTGVSLPVLEEFGVRFSEFVPTLWELIPYSFLVDYFTNIGTIIDGYSLNTSGVAWLNSGVLKTQKFTSTPGKFTLQPLPFGQFDTDMRTNLGGPFVVSREYVRRSTFDPGHLTPSLEFRVPGTSMKWLNIAALATTHRATSRFLRRNGVELL